MENSGAGTGAEGTNGKPHALARGDGRGYKGMRYYDEYTVHGGAENLHNVIHVKRWTRALLSPAPRETIIEPDLFINIVQSR
jgi:hypothetical protein